VIGSVISSVMAVVGQLIASIPSPPSAELSIGPIDLRAYGVLIAVGVLVAVWICGKFLEEQHVGTMDDASSIAMYGVVAGIIGARLYHVATEWTRFSDDLGSIPKIWEGGLGIPGGLLFGIFAGVWQAKRRGIEAPVILTAAAPAIPAAQAIGRWGNWFNQELYGRPTDLPWALEIDDAHLVGGYPAGTTFHPTFLYESLWNAGLAVLLIWIQRRYRLAPGRLMGAYLVGYGIGRFWIEALRIDPTEASDVAGLRWNQWVALAAIVGGAIWLWATRGRRWPDDAIPEPVDDDETGAAADADEPDADEPDADEPAAGAELAESESNDGT
jgi:prolipoprotein diacylglyceryl transferase